MHVDKFETMHCSIAIHIARVQYFIATKWKDIFRFVCFVIITEMSPVGIVVTP